jgi:hypothetical protein
MEEIWKPVPDYEQYSVSNMGRVKRRGKILKPGTTECGYHIVALCKGGIPKSVSIHRLIGKTFLENAENKPTIDHIDRCRTNNHLSNLRWATWEEQMLNRDYPLGKTGHRHITPQNGGYKFQIRRQKKLTQKFFHTLDEALAARDSFLNPSSSSGSGSPENAAVAPEPLPSPS